MNPIDSGFYRYGVRIAVTGFSILDLTPICVVNEKIEGFFDICAARGLTGEQGVIIPAANVRHLMLRQNVIATAASGQFHIHAAVTTADRAIALLTGLPAGEADVTGKYPEGTLNQKVAARLNKLVNIGKSLAQGSEKTAK